MTTHLCPHRLNALYVVTGPASLAVFSMCLALQHTSNVSCIRTNLQLELLFEGLLSVLDDVCVAVACCSS